MKITARVIIGGWKYEGEPGQWRSGKQWARRAVQSEACEAEDPV